MTLRLAALALVTVIVQIAAVSQISIFGVSADLAPLVVMSVGLLTGSIPGALMGFGMGLLVDSALVETLGVPWDRVHQEAEVLEHVLSEELEELIAAKLGNPTRDPHGDPIPTPDLRIVEPDTVALDALGTGTRGTFVRVSDSDPEMLRYLAERGIAPGDRFEIIDKQPFDGPLFARFGGEAVHVLGGALARAMRVEVEA